MVGIERYVICCLDEGKQKENRLNARKTDCEL